MDERVEARIEALRAQLRAQEKELAALSQGHVAPGRRRARRVAGLLAGAFACVGMGLSLAVGTVHSQSCTAILPSPMTTFCAGGTASAAEVNANFDQILTWLKGKTGELGNANIATTGTITGASLASGSMISGVETLQLDDTDGKGSAQVNLRRDSDMYWHISGPRDETWDSDMERTLGFSYHDENGFTRVATMGDKGDMKVEGTLRAADIEVPTLDAKIKQYLLDHCAIRLGFTDSCEVESTATDSDGRTCAKRQPSRRVRVGVNDYKTSFRYDTSNAVADGYGSYGGIELDGVNNGDEILFIAFECYD